MSTENEPKNVQTFLVTRGSAEINKEVEEELEQKETTARKNELKKAISQAQEKGSEEHDHT